MRIAFDPVKNELNVRRRGLASGAATVFDFGTASVFVDGRCAHGETRYVAMGRLGARLHVFCFTEVDGGIRLISFRKANSREVSRHAKVQAAR